MEGQLDGRDWMCIALRVKYADRISGADLEVFGPSQRLFWSRRHTMFLPACGILVREEAVLSIGSRERPMGEGRIVKPRFLGSIGKGSCRRGDRLRERQIQRSGQRQGPVAPRSPL